METSNGVDVVGVCSDFFSLKVGFVCTESLLRESSLAMAACDVDGSVDVVVVVVVASNATAVDVKPPLVDELFLPIGAVPI